MTGSKLWRRGRTVFLVGWLLVTVAMLLSLSKRTNSVSSSVNFSSQSGKMSRTFGHQRRTNGGSMWSFDQSSSFSNGEGSDSSWIHEYGQRMDSSTNPFNLDSDELVTLYSIGCGGWQLLQSVVLDDSWLTQKQPGHLIRIVSDCPSIAPDSSLIDDLITYSQTPLPMPVDIISVYQLDRTRYSTKPQSISTTMVESETARRIASKMKNDQSTIRMVSCDGSIPLLNATLSRFHVVFVPKHSDPLLSTKLVNCLNQKSSVMDDIRSLFRDSNHHIKNTNSNSNSNPNQKKNKEQRQMLQRYPQINRIFSMYLLFWPLRFTQTSGLSSLYVMILDPDFVFLKSVHISELKTKYGISEDDYPMAGYYGLSSKWIDWLVNHRRDEHHSMSLYWESYLKQHHSSEFSGGAPYIWNSYQWTWMLRVWPSMIPVAWSKYNGIESDMYAYMMASVDYARQVPGQHSTVRKHIIIDEMQSTCMRGSQPSFDIAHNYFLHYCSSYKIRRNQGNNNDDHRTLDEQSIDTIEYFIFNKHWMKARKKQLWFWQCESPLIKEPPQWDSSVENWVAKNYPGEWKQYQIAHFAVKNYNQALIHLKSKYCLLSQMNGDKLIVFHEATLDNGDILFHIEK